MIEDWIEQNIDSRIKYTSNPDEIHVCCPVCGETRYRLYINLREGLVYCHNCQFKGSILNLIQRVDQLGWADAVKVFKDTQVTTHTPSSVEQSVYDKLVATLYKVDVKKRCVPLPEEYQELSSTSNIVGMRAMKYLARRGVTPKQAYRHRMGVCATGKYANRVIIPITQEGELKFWVARAISSTEKLKERSPSNEEYQYSKSEVVFNIDNAAKKYNCAVISEGIFDALSWGDIGISLLGKVLYTAQLKTLLDYRELLTEGIYIALDADARDSATQMAEQLSPFFTVKIVEIPDELDDPNNYMLHRGRHELWKLLDSAVEYDEFSTVRRKLHIFGV